MVPTVGPVRLFSTMRTPTLLPLDASRVAPGCAPDRPGGLSAPASCPGEVPAA